MNGGTGMAKLNSFLAVALIVSGLYLVKVSYESRRLFAEIEHAHGAERLLESDRRRLEAERQAQATHLRVESVARSKLGMRAATPANTQYVVDAGLAAAPITAPLSFAPAPAPAPAPATSVGAADPGASR
ncbi:MAG: cell division protein FtsL [Burkholderiaceae bacterium]